MGLQAITYKKNYYLSHRGLIETVFDCLKNLCDLDHSRHRSPLNFFINLWSALIAYTFFDQIYPFQRTYCPILRNCSYLRTYYITHVKYIETWFTIH